MDIQETLDMIESSLADHEGDDNGDEGDVPRGINPNPQVEQGENYVLFFEGNNVTQRVGDDGAHGPTYRVTCTGAIGFRACDMNHAMLQAQSHMPYSSLKDEDFDNLYWYISDCEKYAFMRRKDESGGMFPMMVALIKVKFPIGDIISGAMQAFTDLAVEDMDRGSE